MGDSGVNAAAELAALVNEPRMVHAGGREIAITPIKVRELPAFMRAVEPVLGMASAGADMMTLISHNAEAVIEATAIGARVERDFIDGLDLDDLIAVTSAVIEANADFFVQRLLPAFMAASERLAEKLAGSNSTPASVQQGSAG